jgi:hypothetical protein
MMLLMDGNNSVNDFWGNGLLVDDWLDSLMDMMMNMLALDSRCSSCGVSGLVGVGGVLKLGSLTLESEASLIMVVVVELLVDGILHDVVMLLREDFLMLNRLDGGVVVVLVNLTVDSLGELLMTGGLDVLAGNRWADALGDIGGVAPLAGDAGNCGSSFLHLECKVV